MALVGFLGACLLAVGASLPGAPFADKIPGAWFFGVPAGGPGTAPAHSTGVLLWFELACGFGGVILLCRAWLSVSRKAARENAVPIRPLARILALWSVPILIAPPMFSTDIYSYAAQGEMVSHHINPYLYGPGVIGATPFVALARGVWINTPSPYGPFITGIDGGLTRLADHRVLLTIVFLRLLAVAGVVLIAACLPTLTRSYGKNPAVAFSLGLLNPLVLLFFIGSGHNDAVMVGLLVAGLTLARRGHPALGIMVCALAGAVKVPGLIGVFAIAWTSNGSGEFSWRRGIELAKASVIAFATFEFLSVVVGVGWGWMHTLGASDAVTSWITPVDLLAKIVPMSSASFLHVAHLVGPILAIALSLYAFTRLPRWGLPRVIGVTLLSVVLLSAIVQPWYLVWATVILSVTAGPKVARAICLLSVSVSLVGLVGLGQLGSEWGSLTFSLQVLGLLLIAVAVLVPIEAATAKSAEIGSLRGFRWIPAPMALLRRA